MSFAAGINIPSHLKRAYQCLDKQIDEIHIVGHTHDGIRFSKQVSGALAKYLSPKARIVFHGCAVLEYSEGLKILLKELGSEAKIFAHAQSEEAGRAFDFYQVTLPEGATKIKSKPVKNISEILPKTYIRKWVEKLPTKRLYRLYSKLLRQPTEAQDTREILKEQIIKEISGWKLKRCKRRLKGNLYHNISLENWEKEALIKQIESLEALHNLEMKY